MRVGMFVVSILVVATPSDASTSCMSKTEARQHFGAVHIYWHGADHCWDASTTSHHRIQARQRTPIQQARNGNQPKWHDAMSEMLADDEPVPVPVPSLRAPGSLDIAYREQKQDDSVNGTPWADRWVAIEPLQSPIVARRVHLVQVTPTPVTEAAPMFSARDVVVLAFIAFILTLGTIEAIYRSEL